MYIVGINNFNSQGEITMAHTFASTEQYKNIKDVKDTFPAAAHITKVCGGWLIFDTHSDYDTWRKQK